MSYSLYHLDDHQESLVYNHIIDHEISKSRALTLEKRLECIKIWLILLALIDYPQGNILKIKLLDYGCGWGTLLQVAQGPGMETVGYEVSKPQMTWCREKGIIICNSEEELYEKAPFDICVSTSVLEHLRNPTEAVKTMSSLLKPGGHLFITCIVSSVKKSSGWNTIRKKLARGVPLNKAINPWEHLNYFRPKDLAKLMSLYGFEPVEIPYKFISKKRLELQCMKMILGKYYRLIRPRNYSSCWQLRK